MTRPTWVMHSSAVIVVLAIVLTVPPGSAQQPPSSPSGLTVHPDNGELWQTDNGPKGGDEINIIKRGLNYGWPVVTYGRAYTTDPDGIRSGLPETQLSRIVFNERGLESRRKTLLLELRQRIRDVRQGPDGLVYLTTDMRDGAILKLEPVAEL
jgi:glucose/arabinose dehydrogenase